MRLFLCACILLLCTAAANAQRYTIKGTVADTVNNNQLPKAAVTLIRAKDSVLATFTRTAADGAFVLHPDSAGNFIVMITYPGFADYVDYLKVESAGETDLGKIVMITPSHLLTEFVLRQKSGAIKINGDTTSYNADSFHVKDGATVEDLLKKLPGLQVDKNGQVTAQGEKVQKILVDGEEFFSDDPAVVTKNLQSAAVDQVQVYDKKSDQALFTGIDDGEKTKTINLKLKEDRKKGYFGKIALGGGTDGYFENQALINNFKGKRQLSAFAIMSNTAKVGLGWEDRDKYTDGNESHYDEESGNMYSNYSSGDDDEFDWNGSYSGEGLPKVWTGGLHYANKWHEDAEHVSGNYRFARQNLETVGNTLTQYTLPGSQYFSNESRNSFSTGDRHAVDGLFEWKTDSTANLKVTVNGGTTDMRTSNTYDTRTLDSAGNLLNTGDRLVTNDGQTQKANSSALWRKKLAKKGRTISIDAEEKYKNTDGTGYLRSNNVFFATGASDSTDQLKKTDITNLTLSATATYTEPLSKVLFAEINYGVDVNNNHSSRLSYNKDAGEGYSALDSVYSSDYRYNVLQNRGGANLRFVFKKVKFGIGTDIAYAIFHQNDLLRDTTYNRNYTNLFPRANINWTINKQSHLNINYRGSTQQPSIDQIQPLRQNNDPLNISVGNPSLRQQFNHNFNGNYNSYKVISGQYTYAGGGFNFTQRDISRADSVLSDGRRIYQYVNVNGNYNGYFYGGMGWQVKKLDGLRAGYALNANFAHINSIVNSVHNTSNNNSYTAGLELDYDKEKKFHVHYRPSFTYSNNTSSISTGLTNFWTIQHDFDFTLELPWHIQLNTSVNWNLRQRTELFDRNNNVFTWNAYVSKKFLKHDALELRAQVYDILNQNIGYTRYASGNTVSENNYNTIRRYGMMSLIWNFMKSPAQSATTKDSSK